MYVSYSPGRLRVRDSIFRVEEIRLAVESAVKEIFPDVQISFTEKTSSILAIYPPEAVELEKLKKIVPYLLKIEPKVRFYTPKKKQEILDGIEVIKQKLKEILYSQ